MTSKAHQLIAGLVVRKMRQRGYEIVSFNGNEALICNISLKAPPTIKRHKPDIIGVNLKNKKICIGEAKTPSDLSSKRTKEQFSDYANLILNESNERCELIIGILKSSEKKLKKILRSLKIGNNQNVSYIWMPEVLLPNEENKF